MPGWERFLKTVSRQEVTVFFFLFFFSTSRINQVQGVELQLRLGVSGLLGRYLIFASPSRISHFKYGRAREGGNGKQKKMVVVPVPPVVVRSYCTSLEWALVGDRLKDERC